VCKVADRLRTALDDSDTLGRLGAAAFAVARTCSDADATTGLLQRLHEAFEEPFEFDGKTLRIGVHAGVAAFPLDAEAAESLLACAETALDHAKASNEPSAFFSRERSARIAQRAVLEDQLRQAIVERQFVLHYQPRADLASGELVGAEALIRWQHPQRGLLGPDAFISLAEETGLIVPIGAWVLDAVCAQQAAWIAANRAVVPVAVNVSSVQFARSDLLGQVKSLLVRHRLAARNLEIELTETAVMRDPALAARTLGSLRALGIGLALDDFGTGYSSLAHLRRFPFGSVKIDRVFVTDITRNSEDAAIAKAIIAMAHQLGLKVVAEGVETEGQLTYLRLHGCEELQGHYLSPAVAAEAFEAMLVSHKRLALPAQAPADLQTLLIVDDEPGIRSALNRVLRRDGYRILLAGSGKEALDLLAVNPVQVIIADQRMPEMSGTALLSEVRQLYPDTLRIVLSGYTDLTVVTDAVNRGAVFKFLTKPWDDDQLRELIRDAFRRFQPTTAARP
jgi:EAL domain-containing protein (putative c-di-GMP-specific phosphodiesterase class I)/ActR/RegA family two-component response regulator